MLINVLLYRLNEWITLWGLPICTLKTNKSDRIKLSFLADSACSSNLSHDISTHYFHSSYHFCCDIRAPGEANDKDFIEPANTHSDENDLVRPHDISAMCDGNDINVSTMPAILIQCL